jgi:Zn-dependent membrane protease YugP
MTSQDISFVLMLISSVSLLVIVGLIIFIGIVVVRLLGLFSEVNSASQAMRLDVNKLLYKTASLSNAERQAFSCIDTDFPDP